MTDLIRDLEDATEGSRELSDRVLLACGWANIVTATGDVLWRLPPSEEWKFPPPNPSQSLDDALALVPEGWWYSLRSPNDIVPYDKFEFSIQPPSQTAAFAVEADGSTAPLAVCLAVLKAQEQDQ